MVILQCPSVRSPKKVRLPFESWTTAPSTFTRDHWLYFIVVISVSEWANVCVQCVRAHVVHMHVCAYTSGDHRTTWDGFPSQPLSCVLRSLTQTWGSPTRLRLGASQLQGPAHLYLLYSGMCPPPCQASSNMNSGDQPQVPMLIWQALSQVISRLKIIWVIKIYASTDACLLTWQCTPCGLDRVCAFWLV